MQRVTPDAVIERMEEVLDGQRAMAARAARAVNG
jgi:hypothetical protein